MRANPIIIATLIVLAATAVGCGGGDDRNDLHTDQKLGIGLLLPTNADERYEKYDKPAFEARVRELCADCTVHYANADKDAELQRQQAEAMLAAGVKVLVLGAVDPAAAAPVTAAAKKHQTPVVAYDAAVPDATGGRVLRTNEPVADQPLAAVRRTLAGEQPNVALAPYREQGDAAARLALSIALGKPYDKALPGPDQVPEVQIRPLTVAKDGVKKNVVDAGYYTAAELCADTYNTACKSAGIKPAAG